ncbi:MAG: tRNA (adenosine(37)-N6)-dimethylallyltransferase MiaA [Candidatus Melainabacteria bacterium]|nr:tRNA (adenosine(37)-N6)-dimethylallyltransferase MiaA [Candidatus Melainabacteria bacterium]
MVDQNKKNIFAIVGSTCTFKSDVALNLAKKYPFEIISADSRLVYKDMDIGTSKPSAEERGKVPHHMIDVVTPDVNYTVALYKNEVEKLIEDIFDRDKLPLFVGGTGLYLNAVLSGFSIPKVEPDEDLRKKLNDIPQEELYDRLKDLDPKAAEKIHENDNFRTVRALEVIYATGDLFSKQKKTIDLPFNVVWIGLAYKDKKLHFEKIKKRTISFLKNGLIDETNMLLKKYGELDLFKNTIGYKETIEFLSGKVNKEEMEENIALNTKQYAKRQMTWFKANKDIGWVYLDDVAHNGIDICIN